MYKYACNHRYVAHVYIHKCTNMHVITGMHVHISCVYTQMYKYTCNHRYACTYAMYMYMHMQYTYTHAYIYIYTCTQMYKYTCNHRYACTYACVYTHVYMYI